MITRNIPAAAYGGTTISWASAIPASDRTRGNFFEQSTKWCDLLPKPMVDMIVGKNADKEPRAQLRPK